MKQRRSQSIDRNLHWRNALERLEGAYADSTIRAYRADMEAFETWSINAGKRPLPATPATVAAFVSQEAERHSNGTLKRRLAAIRKVHKLLRLENPVTDEEVLIALRRALRKRPSRPRQALGMTRKLRAKLISACPASLQGKRNRALISLGYDSLCRRSELVALRVEDLEHSERGPCKILIRRSKNDPYGYGRMSYVSEETLGLLRDWLNAAGIENGYIFRSTSHQNVSNHPLHPFSVNRILKETAERAGCSAEEIQNLSGHSMRVGAAQDMIADGFDILPIMQAGGWRSVNVVSRYVENADLTRLLHKTKHSNRFVSQNRHQHLD